MSKQQSKDDEVLYVQIAEAQPNKMFTEQQRASVRFLIYNKPVSCAECGKRKKKHWTLICEFRAKSMGQYSLTDSGLVHLPLTPVCGDHLLAINWKETADEAESAALTSEAIQHD